MLFYSTRTNLAQLRGWVCRTVVIVIVCDDGAAVRWRPISCTPPTRRNTMKTIQLPAIEDGISRPTVVVDNVDPTLPSSPAYTCEWRHCTGAATAAVVAVSVANERFNVVDPSSFRHVSFMWRRRSLAFSVQRVQISGGGTLRCACNTNNGFQSITRSRRPLFWNWCNCFWLKALNCVRRGGRGKHDRGTALWWVRSGVTFNTSTHRHLV